MNLRMGSTTMIAGAMAAAIGFYTLSLHVSAERTEVERLQSRIAADLRDIRALEAELRTRARLPVLQKWNDEVLALSAPTSKQFAESAVQLAAFAPDAPAITAPAAPTVQHALAAQEQVAIQAPLVVKAAYEVPAVRAVAVPVPRPAVAVPAIVDVAAPRKAEAKPIRTEIKAETKLASAPKPAKAKAPAPVKLAEEKPKAALAGLDGLAGAIDNAAAAERGGFRKVSMR